MKLIRRRVHLAAMAALLFCFSSTPGFADTLVFTAMGPAVPGLSALNENPTNSSPGTGTATVTWDTVLSIMTVNVTFSNLTGPNTAAHIHCCVTTAGGTAGVATVTPTFTGFPAGTSGTYQNSFDMLNASSYNPAFVTAHGGTAASAAADLLAGLQSNQTYLNIHTGANPGGEIRGFLQLQQVPEPSSYLLLGIGIFALSLVRRSAKFSAET